VAAKNLIYSHAKLADDLIKESQTKRGLATFNSMNLVGPWYAYVPKRNGSSGRFDAEYYFAGQREPTKSRTFRSCTDDLFFETDTVGAFAWSACGGTINLRINTSLLASKRSAFDEEEVSIALDSKDISQDGFYFAFRSRRCTA
jgi:hypothetical protein